MVLATLAIVVGVFIAIQAPILGLFGGISLAVYLGGMAMASLIIYLLVSICAWYPSRLAARIRPATALHEE
jgi:putative ABC transport system permease protein